jgi:predicted membrane chloride channel (bestrophin family)
LFDKLSVEVRRLAYISLDTIHLKQIVSLYLFALPFTLVKELGWGMIPVVTVVAVSLSILTAVIIC